MARKKKAEIEKSDYVKLTDYILDIYTKQNLEPSWNLLMTQVKNMVKNYNLTYKDILHILQYMVQIEGISFADHDTLGLVPYYIDKTQKYIERYKEVKQEIKDFDFQDNIVFIKTNNKTVRRKKKNENFD